MQRSTRLKTLLGAGLAVLVVVLLYGFGRGQDHRGPTALPNVTPASAAATSAVAASRSATAPAPAPPLPQPAPAPSPHPPGPDQAPSTTAPLPPSNAPVAKLSEAVLMARLRSVAESNPSLAVELARAGNRRFADSPDAPERASIMIHALAAEGLPRDARAEAEYAVNHYPDSAWVQDIEQFTGAHRHRNLTLTDGGLIRAE